MNADFLHAFFRDMKHVDDAATRQWWLDVWTLHIRIHQSNIHIWVICLALDFLALAPVRHSLDSPFLLLGLFVAAFSIWRLIKDWRKTSTLRQVCRA